LGSVLEDSIVKFFFLFVGRFFSRVSSSGLGFRVLGFQFFSFLTGLLGSVFEDSIVKFFLLFVGIFFPRVSSSGLCYITSSLTFKFGRAPSLL
jgi:hypothetical protein